MDTALAYTLMHIFAMACIAAIGFMIVSGVAVWIADRRTRKELDEIERGSRQM